MTGHGPGRTHARGRPAAAASVLHTAASRRGESAPTVAPILPTEGPSGGGHRDLRQARRERFTRYAPTRSDERPGTVVGSGGHRNTSASASDGVLNPSVCRGRLLSFRAMVSKSSWSRVLKSRVRGRYWRSRPLVFSFVSRCHGLAGHLRAPVPGQRPAHVRRQLRQCGLHPGDELGGGVPVGQVGQDEEPGVPLDEGTDGGAAHPAHDQVALPVPRRGSAWPQPRAGARSGPRASGSRGKYTRLLPLQTA